MLEVRGEKIADFLDGQSIGDALLKFMKGFGQLLNGVLDLKLKIGLSLLFLLCNEIV